MLHRSCWQVKNSFYKKAAPLGAASLCPSLLKGLQVFAFAQRIDTLFQWRVSHEKLTQGFLTVNPESHHRAFQM